MRMEKVTENQQSSTEMWNISDHRVIVSIVVKQKELGLEKLR